MSTTCVREPLASNNAFQTAGGVEINMNSLPRVLRKAQPHDDFSIDILLSEAFLHSYDLRYCHFQMDIQA
jgi:hypothetical protein